jgi:hypothetical protein
MQQVRTDGELFQEDGENIWAFSAGDIRCEYCLHELQGHGLQFSRHSVRDEISGELASCYEHPHAFQAEVMNDLYMSALFPACISFNIRLPDVTSVMRSNVALLDRS